jgi:hypothetical protein
MHGFALQKGTCRQSFSILIAIGLHMLARAVA